MMMILRSLWLGCVIDKRLTDGAILSLEYRCPGNTLKNTTRTTR